MADELVRKHRCIRLYLHQVYCHCWDFGEDDSAQGVGEGKVDILELEVNVMCASL
jgi:hypothetical protein